MFPNFVVFVSFVVSAFRIKFEQID